MLVSIRNREIIAPFSPQEKVGPEKDNSVAVKEGFRHAAKPCSSRQGLHAYCPSKRFESKRFFHAFCPSKRFEFVLESYPVAWVSIRSPPGYAGRKELNSAAAKFMEEPFQIRTSFQVHLRFSWYKFQNKVL